MKTLIFLLLLPVVVLAHPISQGALDVELLANRLHVRARIPVEEVLIANAFAAGGAESLDAAWQAHGQYLLQHVQIAADEQVLKGSVAHATEDGSNHIVYELNYPLTNKPKQLTLKQNLLNEFLYAPGNPWEATFAVRIREQGQVKHEGLLLTSKQALTVTNTTTTDDDRQRMFGDYLKHGITHILTGYDHLLFITALVLATVTVWDLVKVITAFTLAHTLTLTLSVLGVVRLDSAIVEPMIAASIVFVAISNVVWPKLSRGWQRWLVAFFFGLFHGLGFAGGLLDAMAGMSGMTIGLAIVAFSLGVELGHQLVVLPIFACLKWAHSSRTDENSRNRLSTSMMRLGSMCISVAGTVYLVVALQ